MQARSHQLTGHHRIAGAALGRPPSAELVVELSNRTRLDGTSWPGLTIYHAARPPRLHRFDAGYPSLFAAALETGGFAYAVIGSHDEFDCHATEAALSGAHVCFALRLEPDTVRAVATTMRGRDAPGFMLDDHADARPMSPLDDELVGIVLRFLRALSTPADRRVLAPLYLQEAVYRLLQGDFGGRLVGIAARHTLGNPLAPALDYIAAHLAEPLTVELLAAQVNLSPSAFSRAFREVTERSPYQYVKLRRLDRARELLEAGRHSVADASRTVGYTSVSHFIKEFRCRFGMTPGDYVSSHTLSRSAIRREGDTRRHLLATAAS